MRKVLLFSLVFCIFTIGFSQNKKKNQEVDIISHQVKLGETVRTISKKYLVEPSEIYKLNKFAIQGISSGMVLYIPVPKKEEVYIESSESTTESDIGVNKVDEEFISEYDGSMLIKHMVQENETLFGISKKYNVSQEEIKKQNDVIEKYGLQAGQILTIKKNNN